jgi:putative redox protein
MVDRIECELEFRGPLTDEQRERLAEIAERCPVHRTLVSEVKIVTALRG